MKITALSILLLSTCLAQAQIDTSFVFDNAKPYGTLDIRLTKGDGHHYYLQDEITFSLREEDGKSTNQYLDMTAWDSSPYQQGHLRERDSGADNFVMNYRLLPPLLYNDKNIEGYPLIVILHGRLERGNCAGNDCYHGTSDYSPNVNDPPAPTTSSHKLLNNDYSLIHAGSNFLEAVEASEGKLASDPSLSPRSFPGFVLFPQNLNGWDVNACQDVIRMIRLMQQRYKIDPSQIFIAGISHGGHGAYEILKRAPWMFSAAILFSAADDANVISQKMEEEIARVPLWIFQGGQDTHPTQQQTERYISAFRKAGSNVRYTLYKELGHGTWNKAMLEPDFFSWLLRQSGNNLFVPFQNASICATSGKGIMLHLPRGYSSYQWEFNGSIIADDGEASVLADKVGRYRGRFLIRDRSGEKFWAPWSDEVTINEVKPPTPELAQIGTLLLKDLNGNGAAALTVTSEHDRYYWYKDGKQISLPGANDTIRTASLASSLGDGKFAVAISGLDGCRSGISKSKQIIFNDRAPLSINAPQNFSAADIGPVSSTLRWSDTSSDETGFEIWRRNVSNKQQEGQWAMIVLTERDVAAYTDTQLEPATDYEYKLRAVSETSRSAYEPSGDKSLKISTSKDLTPPTAPANVSAQLIRPRTVSVRWSPADDNAAVKGYLIYFNDDTVAASAHDTTVLLTGLVVNKVYDISVEAFDAGNNYSGRSQAISVSTYFEGLFYEHSTGAWNSLNEIDWSHAEFTGQVKSFTLSPKTQEDFFNIRYEGYLYLKKRGVYQFRISSNDGSRLLLNDSLLLDNDGIHNYNTVTSPVLVMDSAAQHIEVEFFDYAEADSLLVEYKGPDTDNEWTTITSASLRSSLVIPGDQDDGEISITVFPNPTTYDEINIEISNNVSDAPLKLCVFDSHGKRIYDEMISAPSVSISLPELSLPGVYLLFLESFDGKRVSRRVVIK